MKKLISLRRASAISLSLLLGLASCNKDPITPVQLLINTDVETGSTKPNS